MKIEEHYHEFPTSTNGGFFYWRIFGTEGYVRVVRLVLAFENPDHWLDGSLDMEYIDGDDVLREVSVPLDPVASRLATLEEACKAVCYMCAGINVDYESKPQKIGVLYYHKHKSTETSRACEAQEVYELMEPVQRLDSEESKDG